MVIYGVRHMVNDHSVNPSLVPIPEGKGLGDMGERDVAPW